VELRSVRADVGWTPPSILLHARSISYYIDTDGSCSSRAPLPMQCQCLEWHGGARGGGKAACKRWQSDEFPSTIPAGAAFVDTSVVNNVTVNQWSWFEPLYGSAVYAYVKAAEPSYLVELVADDVRSC